MMRAATAKKCPRLCQGMPVLIDQGHVRLVHDGGRAEGRRPAMSTAELGTRDPVQIGETISINRLRARRSPR